MLFPMSILFLDFKSKEELQLMPQTMEEHFQELEDSDSDSDSSDADADSVTNHPNEVLKIYAIICYCRKRVLGFPVCKITEE